MEMERMQFRGYAFRHNPQSIAVEESRRLARHFCPGAGELLQDLGENRRSVTCKGSFFGSGYEDALAQAEGFRAAARGDAAGLLFLPGIPPMLCHLGAFACEAVGDGRILRYTMVFYEGEAA